MSEYEIRSVGGHVEVYTRGGVFLFSADTVREAMEELDEGLEDELPELPQQPANSAATSTSARVRTKVFLGKIQTPFRLPADAGRRAGRSL